ncbi:hypothetical protein RHS01_08055 [Rhizoctonia solani]|uniref:Uncharacterized protein n=1 Tax=Rhizoctonia solani TaxID=456999 RepID=A0A8H7LZ93_9AGAM|nr:hypothetical protein RHS01_08055 [Rhizoctonia solani]
MLFFSHLIIAAGALMTSVRHSSRPEPGDFVHFVRQGHRSLSTTRLAFPSTPVTRKISLPVSRMVTPKNIIKWYKRPRTIDGRSQSHPDHHSLYSNATWPDSTSIHERVVLTVNYYDGPKDLAVYDHRRALAIYVDTPNDLALYDRPSSLPSTPGQHTTIGFYWIRPTAFNKPKHPGDFSRNGWMLHKLLSVLTKYIPTGEVMHSITRVSLNVYTLMLLVVLSGMLFQGRKRLAESIVRYIYRLTLWGLPAAARTSAHLLFEQVGFSTSEQDCWWTTGEKYMSRKDVLTIVLPHITSNPLPTSARSQSRPTSVRLINRRRGFLRALEGVERSKRTYDLIETKAKYAAKWQPSVGTGLGTSCWRA